MHANFVGFTVVASTSTSPSTDTTTTYTTITTITSTATTSTTTYGMLLLAISDPEILVTCR